MNAISQEFFRPQKPHYYHALFVRLPSPGIYLLCVDVRCFDLNLGGMESVGLHDTDGVRKLEGWLLKYREGQVL